MPNHFTIRVYAIIVNAQNQILLLDERYLGIQFTKFPGGGLEWGEGTLDTLKRELFEELSLENVEFDLFYTTDFFVPSYFDGNVQVMSIYYKSKGSINPDNIRLNPNEENLLGFKWISLDELKKSNLTFPIDKHVVELLTKT